MSKLKIVKAIFYLILMNIYEKKKLFFNKLSIQI